MSPKYAIRNVQTRQYLAWTKNGPVWMPAWKHATKWTSQYKAKQFIEEHVLLYCVPELVLSKKIDEPVPAPAIEGA